MRSGIPGDVGTVTVNHRQAQIEQLQAQLGEGNVILMGFMGSGKSTVGRVLARDLGWDFVDTDRLIESEQEKSIPQIFEQSGEQGFRDMESELAERLGGMHRRVIATGGGFPLREKNLEAARRAGAVVLLMASPDQIWHRVASSKHRPLLQKDDPQGEIRRLLAERKPAYDAIAIKVRTDGKTPYTIAEEILKAILKK